MVSVLVRKCGHGKKGVCSKCEKKAHQRVVAWLSKHPKFEYPPAEVEIALAGEARMKLIKALHEDGVDK